MIEKKWQDNEDVMCAVVYSDIVTNPLLGNGWLREQVGKGLAGAAVACKLRESVKRL
jgi:hypothetical protein